jgi:uncharacterized membrane protein YoaK (UPF0700 family)
MTAERSAGSGGSVRRQSWVAGYFRDVKHGPLPALLLVLTVVTGLVDAVSILSLGRVFVANMTGNVVFIAFALVGAPGFSLSASLSALGGFLVGAGAGGRLVRRRGGHRGKVLLYTAVWEFVLVAAAFIVLLLASSPPEGIRDIVAFLVAVALGAQNASVRYLGVPDMTTTVLTMTLTGIAADIRTASYAVAFRRSLTVVAMFGGAAIGAILVLHANPASALGLAAGCIAIVAGGAAWASRHPASWQHIQR